MLRNIFSKIFLVFLLLNLVILAVPQSAYAATEADVKADPSCQQEGTTFFGITRIYTCGKYTYKCDFVSAAYGSCSKIDNSPTSMVCLPVPYVFSLGDCIVAVANLIFAKIVYIINQLILKPLLWVSSLVFDFVMYFSVVKFKTNFAQLNFNLTAFGVGASGSGIFGAGSTNLIYYLWSMIRDFLNIIIFVTIIYHAVRSMFDGFEDTRKKFTALLVFSLLANFSLLLVEVAIDISNIFTLQAYTLAVQPQSTSSFMSFRGFNSSDRVNSFGEYLRNSVDMNKLTDPKISGVVGSDQVTDMQSTFMFQLGRMVVFAGIIYILLFMAGMLLTRAVILLYAMIISPLIAADLFFKIWKSDGANNELAEMVRGITKKVRADFFDALFKGPLLIFFMFLIGVFAETILSTGVINDINNNFASLPGADQAAKNTGPFVQSLAIFFKFALFFALTMVLFKKINEFTIGGETGTLLKKFGNRFAGRAFAVAGLVGRNQIARRAFGDNAFGTRAMTGLGRILSGENALAKSLFQKSKGTGVGARLAGIGLTTLQIGAKAGLAGAVSAKEGSYNASSVIAGAAKKVTGEDIDFGAKPLGGYGKYDEAARKRVKEKYERYLNAATGSVSVTEEDVLKANKDVKIKLATGENSNVGELHDLLANWDKAVTAREKGEALTLKDRTISNDQLLKLIKDGSEKEQRAIQDKYDDEMSGDALHEKEQKLQKKNAKAVQKQVETIRKEGFYDSIFEEVRDAASGRHAVQSGRDSARTALIGHRKEEEATIKNKKSVIENLGISSTSILKLAEKAGLVDVSKLADGTEEFKAKTGTGAEKQIEDLIKFRLDMTSGTYVGEAAGERGIKEFEKISNDLFSSKDKVLTKIGDAATKKADTTLIRDVVRQKTVVGNMETKWKEFGSKKPDAKGEKKDDGHGTPTPPSGGKP